jgi:uncharacterized membrane protein
MTEEIYPDCRIDRSRSIWEAAKLRGVDFRAIGQEPGWHMEIRPEETLVVLDYGTRRLSFPTPAPQEEQSRRRTFYETRSGKLSLTVLIEELECSDSMSGERFEAAVTMTVGEKVYRGCGRALH